MVNMKDIAVHYDKISAFDMLVDIAKVAGVESIQAALDEIAAQQNVQATGGTVAPANIDQRPEVDSAGEDNQRPAARPSAGKANR